MSKESVIEYLKSVLPQTLVIRISLSDEEADYRDSKVGGSFFWTEPVAPEKIFLAQINCAELPVDNIFPSKGLLQFFVKNDDGYGLFDDDGFAVVYHADTDGGFEVSQSCDDSPIVKPARMHFAVDLEYLSSGDSRFSSFEDEDWPEDVTDAVMDSFSGWGHKLLGYPAFTQYDPRSDDKYDTLLFQLDSDDDFVMWGDCGICNFFINSEKLRNADFSDVLYNWDCC